MNKAELTEKVREVAGLSRSQAESAVDEALGFMMSAIKAGERVSLFGFGTFNPSARAARTGRNPQTGEAVKIPASKGVRFSPAAAFKAALNPKAAAKKAAPPKKASKSAAPAKASKSAPIKKAAPAKKSAPAKTAAPAKKAAKSTKKR